MRKIIVFCMMWLLVVTLDSIASAAEEKVKESEPTVVLDSQLVSKYVGDNGARYINSSVAQSSLGINMPADT